ncbi:MAG TPA: ABC transporter permease [Candidatus Omnitrophota bacterium]|nr:ABC transporter permease [Candidatus Omnitrophota bacterium]HPT39564.1 ABC transporter permease [Candidatus Omnitrophota bacterium]
MNLLGLAFKNLCHRKIRTGLTILGVGTSIAVFVSLVGLVGIFTDQFRQMYKSRQTDLIVREKGNFDFLSSGIDEAYADKIIKIPEIVSISKILIDFSLFGTKNYFLVLGWDQNSSLFSKLKIQGRRPENEDEALVGLTISRKLNKKIGDSIEVKGSRFTIVGIFESKSMFEEGSLVILLEKLQKIKKVPGKVTLLNLVVNKDGFYGGKPLREKEAENRIRSLITQMLPDIEVRNVDEMVSADNTVNLFLNFAWAISVIAFITAILGIINSMVTSVLEQTSKIGILLAIGWRKSRILSLVLYESILLGVSGGIFGLILGYGIMNVLMCLPQLQNIGRIDYNLIFMAKVIIISLAVGFLSGIYPAVRAILIKPIEALRYE